mmetsp:Transcript_12415/g.30275  ORF Transcript_12415/g.30275 Transcript_12415/m.30275 type:complete len:96 (+) Transcript_12415:200-487(+)
MQADSLPPGGAEEVNLEGVVVVFAAASLTTLGFLATHCSTLRGHGDLGLQQVLVAIVLISVVLHLAQFALGMAQADWGAFLASVLVLVWNAVLLL